MSYACITFESYDHSVAKVLDEINAPDSIRKYSKILIKPNLVNTSPHPITTHPKMCEALIKYIRRFSDADIVVGDGCGSPNRETSDVFEMLGYTYLEKGYNIKLVDLNHVKTKLYTSSHCIVHKDLYLPTLIDDHYIISLPVLKAHSLADITGAMKNMMGLLPPAYYSGIYGSWKKAVFHNKMHESIIDLYHHVPPHLSVLDASIGLPEFHLGGAICHPPVNKMLAGYDAKEIDRKAAELLGLNWRTIGHLR